MSWLIRGIEFKDSSAFNTHPVPQAMFSAAVLIVMAEIPDGLCQSLFTYVASMHFGMEPETFLPNLTIY